MAIKMLYFLFVKYLTVFMCELLAWVQAVNYHQIIVFFFQKRRSIIVINEAMYQAKKK